MSRCRSPPRCRTFTAHIDARSRIVHYVDPEARPCQLPYDRLVVTVGSVTKVLPVAGTAEHSHGFKGIPEALYLRDHMIRQIELAAATIDPVERAERLTFVVVGAGYTGTEVAAAGQLLTAKLIRRYRALRGEQTRWLLLQRGDHVLPEMRPRMRAPPSGCSPDAGWRYGSAPRSTRPPRAITRGYHLYSLPANRPRIIADWILDAFMPRLTVQLGLVRSGAVPLDTADPELPRYLEQKLVYELEREASS